MTSQFSDMKLSSNFFDVVLFLLSSLVTGTSFLSISSLVLELWQFSFIKDWPEIQKSEIPPFKFCPISGDWDEPWIPNLARMYLIECYWIPQNARLQFLQFLSYEGKTNWGWEGIKSPPLPRLGLMMGDGCKGSELILVVVIIM